MIVIILVNSLEDILSFKRNEAKEIMEFSSPDISLSKKNLIYKLYNLGIFYTITIIE